MKTIKQQIEQKEKELEILKKKFQEEENKVKTLIIQTPYGKVEIEKKIHHFDKTYAECEKDCPEGWQIPTYEVLQFLRNSKFIDELNLLTTWEFVINPDEISKKNNYVAGFYASSDWAYLNCYREPVNSYSSLGVRYMRFLKEQKEQICKCGHLIDDHVGNGQLEECMKCDCEYYEEQKETK